jgi:hypothetical protein
VDTVPIDLNERLRQKIGRPSRVRSVAIRFTESEVAQLEAAAKKVGVTLREWSRELLLRSIQGSEADVLFTELIATRMLLLNLIKPVALGDKITTKDFADISAQVRKEKRRVAQEVRQQYAAASEKEQ